MKWTRLIVVSALLCTTALNLSATARAEPIALRVVPVFDPSVYAGRGAVGLMVPGTGGSVSRAGALASLERGKSLHALLGGVPKGPVLVRPSPSTGSKVTVYVSLPPPGRTLNARRYPVAVVGCGFHGLLTSSATRIPGLVFVADIAPALVRLRTDGCHAAPLGWETSANAPARLKSLDLRLRHVNHARGWLLVALLVVGGFLALVRPTASVFFWASAVVASLLLSALHVDEFWTLVLGVPAIAVALAWPVRTRLLPLATAAFFVLLLLVFSLDTQLSSLAVLGAHPEGGSRFYGVPNQMETLLLAPTLAAVAAASSLWSRAGIALLALFTIGWSNEGADGGGLVVYAVAFAVLWLRSSRYPVTIRRTAVAAAAIVVVVAVMVGIDAALGGSSHVTHAASGGTGSLVGDLGRRLHLSWLTVTSSAGHSAEFAVPAAVLAVIAVAMRTGPTVDAILVALVASFLVNDSPLDVAFLGALGSWALAWWEAVDSRAMRRPAAAFASLVLVLVVAGCGGQGVVQPLPNKVVGTLPKASPTAQGKQLFTANGCVGCHTYAPAGATGKIGPDLDKLAKYAKQAKQPLVPFVRTSITDPNAYIQPGYPKNVMPNFSQLPSDQVTALVEFLTKKS